MCTYGEVSPCVRQSHLPLGNAASALALGPPRVEKSKPALADLVVISYFIFQKIGQNGRPRGREAPQSISFDESSRIKSVWARRFFGTFLISFAKLNQLGRSKAS